MLGGVKCPAAMMFHDSGGGGATRGGGVHHGTQFHAASCCPALFLLTFPKPGFPSSFQFCEQSQVSLVNSFSAYISQSWFLLLAIKNANWYGKPTVTLLLGEWPQMNYYSLFINPNCHEIRQKHFLLFTALRRTLLRMPNLKNRVPPVSSGGGRLLIAETRLTI